MAAYYNEHDPKIAAWLRELVKAGLVADGEVDERSIEEVRPADLVGFDRCHFFAGIGGWDYALNLAGWGARSAWTGSCPCQPFSSAGAQAGGDDPRHLWPAWFRLIRECCPDVVFGEQVESAVGHGWLDLVCDDLEGEGYAAGAVCLPACSVGAPHLRQRLWFVAESHGEERALHLPEREPRDTVSATGGRGAVGELADADKSGPQRREQRWDGTGERPAGATGVANPWSDLVWLPCRDGKARPTQPGLQPLAHGVSARVGRLRGYGNAIVPQVAAEVIRAYMDLAGGDGGEG